MVRRYSRGVFFVLNQSGADRVLAEDLFQETFRLVIEKTRNGEVRHPERFTGFILGIARNLTIEYFRANTRAQAQQNWNACVMADSPLDGLLEEERAEFVRHVLAAMPCERDRAVLHRYYFNDDDKESICAALGICSLQFNRILSRARERYRKAFDGVGQLPAKANPRANRATQVANNKFTTCLPGTLGL